MSKQIHKIMELLIFLFIVIFTHLTETKRATQIFILEKTNYNFSVTIAV